MALPDEADIIKKDPTMENDDLAVDIDPEIEVIDDTPPEDRHRKPLAADDKAPTDEELDTYSDDVKKRIGKEIHRYHDERRAKEAAARERDEAIAVANRLLQEKKSLEQRYKAGENAFINQTKEKTSLSMAEAKRAYKTAYELGDAEAMADAQEKIAEAKLEQRRADEWAQQAAQREEQETRQAQTDLVQSSQSQQPRAPEPEPEALDWAAKNKWFGQDEEMTQFAYGAHAKLVAGGLDPKRDADEYYKKLNQRMRNVFPDYEWDEPVKKRNPSVVAPVTRGTKTTTRIRLTQSQLSVAKRLGLTPLQYATQVAKLQSEA